MTSQQLFALISAGFLGGLAFGMTGFAYGVIVSLLLLNFFPHHDVVFIIVFGGTILNLTALPRFWESINFKKASPYLVGASVGVPLGFYALRASNAETIRTISIILILSYCIFALRQVKREPIAMTQNEGFAIDGIVGLLGGVIGGLSGLGPLLPSIWYGMRGHDKDTVRGLIQVFGIYVQGLTLSIFLATGTIQIKSISSLFPLVPAILIGSSIGIKIFNSISTIIFKWIVIWLSLIGSMLMLIMQIIK